MPPARSHRAPFFSGRVGDPLDEFLREYDELATSCNLTAQQKVETVLRYIPHDLRDLWKILEGYPANDWDVFHQSLQRIYEGTSAQSRYSKQKLYDFVHYNSRTRMRDEEDVIQYYRQFLVFCQPLIETRRITDDERNSAFWYGFHPDDQDKLSTRLVAKFPDQAIGQPYGFEDVFKIARVIFASSPFVPFELQERWDRFIAPQPSSERPYGRGFGQTDRDPRAPDHEGRGRDREPYLDFNPRDAFARSDWDLGRTNLPRARAPTPPRAPSPPRAAPPRAPGPSIETKTVRFKEPSREEEDRELDDLMDKMHGLNIRERAYAVLYARCAHRYPDVARDLPKPEISQSYAFQNPPPSTSTSRQPWSERSDPTPPAASTDSSFFRPHVMGCSFCSKTEHRIRECPIAQEYVRTGRAVIVNDRIHLPNGQPIPSDTPGRNLQLKINSWIAGAMADAARNSPFTRDSPPHATASSFEIVGESTYGPPVQQAHIVEVPTTDNEPNDDNVEEVIPSSDLFDVYATEKKKRDAKASKLPEFAQASESTTPAAASPSKASSSKTSPSTTSAGKAPASTPTSTTANTPPSPSTSRAVPQYRYQSNAKDQQLTTELYQWLLDGKLSLVTPAHILAASPAIRKELVERLRTCRVDAAGFEEISTTPFSVLELSTPRIAEYSLPLREIDVLINGTISEAGVLDQGSQIIVIWRDLAQEAGALVNPDHQLEMEGANGLVSKTLGCAENLSMQVGDVSFKVHAHVVDRAPFRLLLGRLLRFRTRFTSFTYLTHYAYVPNPHDSF